MGIRQFPTVFITHCFREFPKLPKTGTVFLPFSLMFSPHEMGRNISPHFIDLFFSEKCLVEVATRSGEARHPLGQVNEMGRNVFLENIDVIFGWGIAENPVE